MKKLLTLPLVALAFLVVAAPADAKAKRPTERARIHRLEKQVNILIEQRMDLEKGMQELGAAVTDLRTRLAVSEAQAVAATNRLACFSPTPMSVSPVLHVDTDAPDGFLTPDFYLIQFSSNCFG